MKKHKRAIIFYDQIERLIMLYGDYDTKDKLDFVKSFMKKIFRLKSSKTHM